MAGTRLVGDHRITLAKRAEALYQSGASIRSTAKRIGRSYDNTRTLLLERGVQLRGRGGSIRKAAV